MTPRIFGQLSFFDESPLWLGATITSLAPHIDHLIAVDGAYALYPDGQAQSRSDQACAIVETCQAAGLGLTLHRPQTVWYGNEVEKRNHMFRLAELEATPEDWYWVIDADCVIYRCPADLHDQLANTDLNVAEVTIWERGDPYRNPARLQYESTVALPADFYYKMRMLFRALPGIHCDTAHYMYRTADGHRLWGYPGTELEEALDLSNGLVQVEHRTHYRPLQRHENQDTYYKRREQAGIEKKQATVDA